MRKLKLILVAAILAGSTMASIAPATATVCSPKGCSGGCHLGDLKDASVDLRTLTVELPRPIVCYA